MEDRFERQLKKGVLEMLVLGLVCRRPSYGYELLALLAAGPGGLFRLKEGTLYPILYRLEDDGMIRSAWQTGEGRAAPKKVYTATGAGRAELARQKELWAAFKREVDYLEQEGTGK